MADYVAAQIALLFPGQGTQSPGMGKVFADTKYFDIAKNASDVLGQDLASLICDESPDALSSTHNAQLAVLITSLMSYEKFKEKNETPICFAGHSLGQVTALICAGVLSFEEGIKFASIRAQETQKCADNKAGAMAALLGADNDSANELCNNLDELWVANDNAPGQIVVAGNPQSIEKAQEVYKDYAIKKVVKLPVNGAFHTPYMEDATEALRATLSEMTFNKPVCGVASNDDGRAYTVADVWQEKLALHVSRPVLWRHCMDAAWLLAPKYAYEIGYGNTLAGLAKRCTPELEVKSFYTGDDE